MEVEDGGIIYSTLSYLRAKGLATASMVVEVSSDLFTWQPGPSFTTVVSVSDNGDGTETVTERMNNPISSSPREFMRLGVPPAQP